MLLNYMLDVADQIFFKFCEIFYYGFRFIELVAWIIDLLFMFVSLLVQLNSFVIECFINLINMAAFCFASVAGFIQHTFLFINRIPSSIERFMHSFLSSLGSLLIAYSEDLLYFIERTFKNFGLLVRYFIMQFPFFIFNLLKTSINQLFIFLLNLLGYGYEWLQNNLAMCFKYFLSSFNFMALCIISFAESAGHVLHTYFFVPFLDSFMYSATFITSITTALVDCFFNITDTISVLIYALNDSIIYTMYFIKKRFFINNQVFMVMFMFSICTCSVAYLYKSSKKQHTSQEIPAKPPHAQKVDDIEGYCVICQEKSKNVVLLPCRHLCLCEDCMNTLIMHEQPFHRCPMCRKLIGDHIVVYI